MILLRSLCAGVFTAGALASFAATAQLKAPSGAPAPSSGPGLSSPAPATAAKPAAAPDADDKAKAGALAAAGWLALLDRKDWGTAWDGSAAMFRASVPLGAWMDGVPKLREPMGALVDRQLAEAAYRDKMEGRPAGDYVTVIFDATFDKRPAAQETVTTVREADGRWRVTGYMVK